MTGSPETPLVVKPPRKPQQVRNAKPTAEKTSAFTCEFCKHPYVTERALLVHTCEPKRRYIQRDEKHVKMAYIAFTRVYATQTRSGRANPPSYDKFAASNLYPAFVRFGRYLMNINALNPIRFIDFLLRVEAPIDRWENPRYYEAFVRELNKVELPLEALERNVMLMQQWALETGESWTDFFRKISAAQATLWIQSGRISPWIILTAPSAEQLILRLSPEQGRIVDGAIDMGFWTTKISRHQADVDYIRDELAAAGV